MIYFAKTFYDPNQTHHKLRINKCLLKSRVHRPLQNEVNSSKS